MRCFLEGTKALSSSPRLTTRAPSDIAALTVTFVWRSSGRQKVSWTPDPCPQVEQSKLLHRDPPRVRLFRPEPGLESKPRDVHAGPLPDRPCHNGRDAMAYTVKDRLHFGRGSKLG